jgi:hypothetical protein
MDRDWVTISMRRDAAHYVSMLLEDQLVALRESVMTEHLLPIRCAYEHVNEEIEHALALPVRPQNLNGQDDKSRTA